MGELSPTTPSTPTGEFLGHLRPGTPEWDAARAGLTVTATEIAAVMGLSPWTSRFTLWHKKAGLPTERRDATGAMRWGLRLEDDVEAEFLQQHPEFVAVDAGTWRHRERPWQRCTPDRLLYRLDRTADWDDAVSIADEPVELLEIKTSPYGDGWENGLPVYYRAQVLWQLDTLGFGTGRVALLIGAGWEYREYIVERDETDLDLMRKEAANFLDSIERGERPPIDASASTYQTVRAQAEGRDDIAVEVPPEMADRYETALADTVAAEAALTGARAELLDAIGDGRWATVAGRRVAQRTVRNGRTYSLIPCKKKASTP